MNANQQHMLDLYRFAQHDEPAPPAPGTGDLRALRAFRTWRRFQAVVDERTAARRGRWAVLFGRPRTSAAPAAGTSRPVPAAAPVVPAAARPAGRSADPRCRA
ncbi:hypothetical protein [Streptomyces cinnamoneus]|uniref:hypothetical protein n=1 Tax=Streptomyces sp. NPDC053079 TaxID=3365697 RepID=UPI0009044FE2